MTGRYTPLWMRALLSLALSVSLGLVQPAQAVLAGSLAEPARLAAQAAIPKPYVELLKQAKYVVRDDGSVWTADQQAVASEELPFLLHRLESGRRLQALLKLDMLLSNSDGEKYLTPVEREQLRKIVRENWPFFTLGTRKDFRHFFSVQELEEMNRDPAPTDRATALLLTDPEPGDYSNAELPPALKPVPVPRLLPAPPPPQRVYAADDGEPVPAKGAAPAAPAVYYVAPMAIARGGSAPPAAAVLLPAAPQVEAPVAAFSPAPVVPAQPQAAAPAAPAPAPAAVAQPVAAPAPPVPAPTTIALGAGVPDAGLMKPWTPPPGFATAAPQPSQPLPPGITIAKEAPSAVVAPPAAVNPAPAAVTPAQAAAAPPAPAGALPAHVEQAAAVGAGPPAKVAPPPVVPEAPAPAVVDKPILKAPPTQPVAEAGLPAAREVPRADFERFLADAPYGKDAKALLRLISEKAAEPARSRALAAVLVSMPQIVFDTARAGLDSHAALLAMEANGTRAYTIALSPGPILYEKKKLFGANPRVMVSDSAKIYASLHLPAPPLDALKRDAPAVREEQGRWGVERVYADDSRRGTYTPQQQAGYLLRKLLRLDAKRNGWDASPYAAEAYARSAQWIFYTRVMLDAKSDAFLDPETRATFRQWRDHPQEYRDHLVHTLAAGRVQTIDPVKGNAESQAEAARAALNDCVPSMKREMQYRLENDREALKKDALALARAGLYDDNELDTAHKAIEADFAAVRLPEIPYDVCVQRYQAEANALRASAAIFAEMSQTERLFRADTATAQ